MKPYYEHAGITIYHGDCRDVLPSIDVQSIDLLLSDPPYGVNFDTDYTRFTGMASNKTHKPVANDDEPFDPTPWLFFKRVILWGANCYSERLPMGSWLVWDKRFDNGSAFLADAEVAWMKGGHGVYILSVTKQGFVRPEPTYHPTQKPESLMRWCIQKAGEGVKTVLDPYMGSGTTLRAAKDLGRNAIGIELEEEYCERAAKRLQQEAFNLEATA